ncbi:EAL domain-containing protein [Undibacterium sp. Xuan67W]|uniref:PAS domain-containing protein n=1 Tax=Undibacterium sp. Xuan67W TaxID=3413057 RepID=UPI003BF30791
MGGWEVDLTTNKITWSDQTYRIHGVPVGQEQTLESAIAFYAPGARPIIQAAVSNAIETGAGWDMELPFNRMNGESIWVRVVGNVDFENGDPVRIVGAFQDVTFARAQRLQLEDAIDRFSLATESGQIGIWEYNLIDQTLIWDPLMYQIYGVTNSSPLEPYQLWAQQIHPDDLQNTELALSQAIQGGTPFDFEFRLIWPDASVRHVRATARIQRDESGTPLKVVGANWDITKLRRLTAQLAEQHELLQVTLQSIGDAVITTDSKGAVSWLNPVAERMTGWLSSEAIGRPLTQIFNIVNEDTRKPTENPVATCMSQGKIVGLANHTVLISRDGEEFGIEDSAAPILNKSGELLGVVLVFHDVTEQRRLSGEMSFRATHDSLTGLVNRAEFEARLRKTLNSAHEDRSEHALMYIDLDQFKLVNDACGHSAGDQLLQQISKLLLETVRARDTLARLGGDEFAVILEHCSTEQAQRVAQQICDRMDDYRFVHDGKRFRIGASIGLVSVDLRWKNAAAILQAADTSCYAAKEAGRNRVHAWFDTDLAMRARHGEMQWAARIEQAIDENRFVLFAQKIVPLNDKEKGMHAEVLIRMLDEDRSIVPPGAFLPAAERFHLASRIDRWVLQHTLEWIKNLNDLQLVNTISVNLSGQSIGDRAFHAHAIETLRAAGHLICTKLCFEITETAAITNMADATIFIEQVRALGVKTALDDFGAGASSFGYLKSLSVDFLKIDGQFVKDIIDDPMDDVAVKCFAEVAKVVGVKTVAEFVDKPEVLSRLRDIGIDYAQGFLLHKPAPIDDLFLIGERVLN